MQYNIRKEFTRYHIMGKRNTFQKIIISAAVIGTAMYAANKYIFKKATEKDLLNDANGHFYPFKYGNVFYEVRGEGSPVLLVHDIDECSSSVEWSAIVDELAKTHTVYTLDLLGCGRSDKPKLTYNNILYVQLITDFIKDVIKTPTDVIATGKSVAPVTTSTKLCKDMISRIILINPTDLQELNEGSDFLAKLKKYLIVCPLLGTFVYHMAHAKNHIEEEFLCKHYSNPSRKLESICDCYYESCHKDQSGSKYLYASLLANNLNMNINHIMKSLDKEVFIISGEDFYESAYVPEDYASLNENIDCVSILNTSYLPQLEAPEKVLALISNIFDASI